MRHFRIRKGEWPSSRDAPPQTLSNAPLVRSAAVLGTDLPGLRPRFEVEEGDLVAVGQVLFRDRKYPEVAAASPIAGRVASLDFGPRRTLSACIIEAEDTDPGATPPNKPDLGTARQTLLAKGVWPAFRTRPFGRMPAPSASPAAIVVNAVHAVPQAPNPVVVLADRQDAFRLGLQCLRRLTEGTVFVCQSPGPPLAADDTRTTCVAFSGSRASGLASTQIDRLCPASPQREVWTVGYQDVIAIGHLFATGEYRPDRVVAISGPAAKRPRLLRTCLGARIADLCVGETGEALSGDRISGRRAAFLGRFDDQITLLSRGRRTSRFASADRFSHHPRPLVPTRQLERALAIDIPAVPLLRALAVGDSEAASQLGCLSLVEEDVAALARHCTSGADYPRLLRRVLDELMEDAA
ncbi:MAG: hypothetical protein QNJ20_04030 [Paracoccaceae bacterium]|nr:hypothetical protein [Paracoccaceae bacterium]